MDTTQRACYLNFKNYMYGTIEKVTDKTNFSIHNDQDNAFSNTLHILPNVSPYVNDSSPSIEWQNLHVN